ncbi:MAG: hypothetical protein DAHOPDDO_00603 [Ignavibacteriaceae bacterium]|nr:hypothetical protein [Ignavibacteriaceae bacterium]
MCNSSRVNYARFIQLLGQDESETILVVCPWCFHETPFDLLSIENHCQHCSININQELLDVIQEGDS